MTILSEARIWAMSRPWQVALVVGVLGAIGLESLVSHDGEDLALTLYHYGVGFLVGGVVGRLAAQFLIVQEEGGMNSLFKDLTK